MSGSASLDLERQMLSHTLAIAPMPTLARVYVALCETAPTEAAGGAELAGGGYARTVATFALLATPANAASNATSVEFPAATASWGTVTHFEIWTAATGGTRLYWGQLLDPADGTPIEIDVVAGNVLRFSPGSLVVQAADADPMTSAPWLPQGWAGFYDVRSFGIICDGVTDQGAQLNAALASTPLGTRLYIPASLYTTQTILVRGGRKLVMPTQSQERPSVGSPLLECTCKIIGSSNLSPVVLCMDNETGLDHVAITRNGTPAAGSIGLQVLGQDHIYTCVYSYNHARCIQVGALRAAPVNGQYYAITTRFDHCIVWRGYEDFLYLINAPETTIFDMRFGLNGETDPINVATSLVCIDGDENSAIDAGSTNTVNFVRCQFNTGGGPNYTIRFYKYGSGDGWISLLNCYSGGAKDAFLYVDPNCNTVRHVSLVNNLIAPLASTEVFISDTGHKLTSFELFGNHIAGGVAQPAAGMTLQGIGAIVIGNIFNGAFTVRLDSLAGGVFSDNTANTIEVVGAFTGTGFVASGNTFTTMTQTATGVINYMQPNATYGQQITVGKTGQAGRIDFKRGTDGAATAYIGILGATGGGVAEFSNAAGSPVVRMNAANTGGVNQFMVNGVEVGRLDVLGLGLAKSTTAAAPGAASARLAFVTGTTAGTAKLVAYAGTSTTPVTILDNIGTGF